MVPCHRCGVELDESERYCPYCHAPSPGSRLKPTWAPQDRITASLDDLEDEPPPTAALDGTRCPRCERIVDPGSAFCSGCGMGLEDPAARAGWQPPAPGEEWPTGWGSEFPVWPRQAVEEVPAFEDSETFGRVAQGLLGLLGGVAFMGVAASIAWQQSLTGSDDAIVGRAGGAESFLRMLDRVGLLVLLGVVVVFAIWSARAYQNLPSLGARGLRWRPQEVMFSWLIPGINFTRPFQVLADLWRGSDPTRPLHPAVTWRSEAVPSWLRIWWGAAVATPVLLVAVSGLVDPTSVPIGRQDAVALVRIVVHGVELLAAVLAFWLIGDVMRRQRRRAQAIGWPALVGYRIPPPDSRIVNASDLRPIEVELRRQAAVHSADVAGRY